MRHLPQTQNPYGLMRAPWNCLKSKYLTRVSTFCGLSWGSSYSGTAPTCEVRTQEGAQTIAV